MWVKVAEGKCILRKHCDDLGQIFTEAMQSEATIGLHQISDDPPCWLHIEPRRAINSLIHGRCSSNHKLGIVNLYHRNIFPVKLPSGGCHVSFWLLVNTVPGNGLVLPGNKPSHWLVLTKTTYGVTRQQWLNPYRAEFILGNIKTQECTSDMFSWHRQFNFFILDTRAKVSWKVNIMVAVGLLRKNPGH